MHEPLLDLHRIYYEPLPRVLPSLPALLSGPPVRKLLYMSTPEDVKTSLRPHFDATLKGRATAMQAVPDMLEIVPPGVNKGVSAGMHF
jgi:hypothetical protein